MLSPGPSAVVDRFAMATCYCHSARAGGPVWRRCLGATGRTTDAGSTPGDEVSCLTVYSVHLSPVLL